MTNVKLYTVKEAAKIVGVSTNTLYKYLDEDRIHAARGSAIQGRFRIPESALEEFLGVKLSTPEPELNTPGVEGAQTPGVSGVDEFTEAPINPVGPPQADNNRARLPIKFARILLILALIAMLLDLIIARSVSLPASLSRIFFLAVTLLLAYQEGGYRRG